MILNGKSKTKKRWNPCGCTHTHTHTGILENKNKKSSVQKNGKRVEFQNIKYVEKLKMSKKRKKLKEKERRAGIVKKQVSH